MPTVRTWVSLTPGQEVVDASLHPLVVSVTVETAAGPVTGLKVRAEFLKDGHPVTSLALTDTGTMRKDLEDFPD